MGLVISAYQPSLPFEEASSPWRGQRGKRRPTQARPAGRKPLDRRLVASLSESSRVVFLDIETTGLSQYYDEVTLVGWLRGGTYHVHIAGDDPSSLLSTLASASALVTFNGTLFDLPFLRRTFPGIVMPAAHADLRYLTRRIGLTGGQKAIEASLGIALREGVEDVDGAEAVLLWHRYLRGDQQALRRLIDYNRCDVAAMTKILDKVMQSLVVNPDLWLSLDAFGERAICLSGWTIAKSHLPPADRLNRQKSSFETVFAATPAIGATVVGIDLTGSETKPSGWCLLEGPRALTAMVASDADLVQRTVDSKPTLVSIDSPLSIPYGRQSVFDSDPHRAEFGIMRRCERELKRRGINVYPCLLPSMQRLTERGMRLAARFRALGIPVIESYPGAAQDIMGIPRKGAGEKFLKQGLADFGIIGEYLASEVRHDELDAITSAVVGSFFLAGKFEALSGPLEEPLIVPDLKADQGPLVIGISGRICAGKTTAARALEQRGFAYTRYSLVVDDEIRSRGGTPDRASRQLVGSDINQTKGQRWLCERVLARVGNAAMIVVDGMRFLEDRAFLMERFGARFLQLHVVAPREMRSERYPNLTEAGGTSFDEAEAQVVEREVDRLGEMAATSFENISTVADLEENVCRIAADFAQRSGEPCLFRLS